MIEDVSNNEERVEKVIHIDRQFRDHYKAKDAKIRKNTSMVFGDQWNAKLKSLLKSQDRPVISLNFLKDTVRQVIGVMLQNDVSYQFEATGDNDIDPELAEIWTSLLLQIEHENRTDLLDRNVLAQAVISSAGIADVDVSFEKDERGRIVTFLEDNTEVLIDPNARDPYQSDWKRVVKTKWMGQQDILDTWGDKISIDDFGDAIQSRWKNLFDRLWSKLRSLPVTEEEFRIGGLYRIIELWERVKVKVVYWYDPQTFEEAPEGFSDEEYELSGFIRGERIETRMQMTVVFPYANIQLEHIEQPYYYFPFAICVPSTYGQALIDTPSFIDDLISLQEELNRLHSVINDTVQRSSNNNVVLPAGNEETQKDMQARGSKPGQYFTMAEGSGGGIQTLESKLPNGAIQLLEKNEVLYQRVSGLPWEMGGFSQGGDQSGVLFTKKIFTGHFHT